jgi:uncharacterized protein YndB with AHSA1/START domain
MAGVEQQIEVNAPAEKVFTYVADISRHGEWGNPSQKLQVQKTSEGPVGQGSTFKSVGQQFGTQNDEVTITEFAPNQRVVYESKGKAGHIRHTFDVAAAGGGTQLTKSFEVVKAAFPFVIFQPIVQAFLLPGNLKADLERIKAKVEGDS